MKFRFFLILLWICSYILFFYFFPLTILRYYVVISGQLKHSTDVMKKTFRSNEFAMKNFLRAVIQLSARYVFGGAKLYDNRYCIRICLYTRTASYVRILKINKCEAMRSLRTYGVHLLLAIFFLIGYKIFANIISLRIRINLFVYQPQIYAFEAIDIHMFLEIITKSKKNTPKSNSV